MGRCMGQSSLTLRDGTVVDLDREFPSNLKTVALSMSGGVESASLLLLLIQRYGAENIHVFSGGIEGRRSWESKNAKNICAYLGVKNFTVIYDNFRFMTPEENGRLLNIARKHTNYDAWFNGANKLLFAETKVQTDDAINKLREHKVFLPFIKLFKQHTIDIMFALGRTDVLYKTLSCTIQDTTHCGECYCCHERVRGFAVLGEIDQAIYDRGWDEMLEACFYSDRHLVNKS
jgi:7-cyano-7-deazaguanine synthase in queuosine biosynthesis